MIENFFIGYNPHELIKKYGSPLYVYNENILRQRCREIKNCCPYSPYHVHYSAKANSNISLLEIVRDEGIYAEAVSPGEIVAELAAGYVPAEIFFVVNNVSADEMRFAIEKNILLSVDSLSQLKLYGQINPGGKIALRFNPGIGDGHHEKVTTGGDETKFGINIANINEVKKIIDEYRLILVGINQHIGSLMMDSASYIAAASKISSIAKNFSDLEFIDFGGGFGTPYRKKENEKPIEIKKWGNGLAMIMERFNAEYGKHLTVKIEPGRFISAECGMLLGTVHAVKREGKHTYVGTDLGFNVFMRPILYDSFHEVDIIRKNDSSAINEYETVRIVGNICETGDYIAKDMKLPYVTEGDITAVSDTGAYGYVMASTYNNRPRPAEILLSSNADPRLIRRRDSLDDILKNMHDCK